MSEMQSSSAADRTWTSVIGTLGVFGLLGPPLAHFAWRLSLFLLDIPNDPEGMPSGIFDIVARVASEWPMVYLTLGVPFLCVGAIVVWYGLKKGRPPLWIGLCPVAALFAGLLALELLWPVPGQGPWILLLPAVSGFITALVCGAISYKLW
jgi:hypothetical protein